MGERPKRASFPRKPLSADEAAQLTEHLSELAKAGLPLTAGLRAAAKEETSPRLAEAFRELASQLEQGRPLGDVLSTGDLGLPEHVRGLVEAGIRSGELGHVLTELVEHHRAARDLWRDLRVALAYPAILIVLVLAVFVFLELCVVPPLIETFAAAEDHASLFGHRARSSVPPATRIMIWLSETGMFFGGFAVLALVLLAVVVRSAIGRARWRRFLWEQPIIGPLYAWTGVVEFCRLLSLLIDQAVPLPQALQLTAAGVRDASVSETARSLAKRAAAGRRLSDLLATTGQLPSSLVPIVRWGEQANTLAESLRAAAGSFEGRVRLRFALLKSVLPPVVLIILGLIVLHLIVGLFASIAGHVGFSYFILLGRSPPQPRLTGVINLASLTIVGMALLWTLQLVYRRVPTSDDALRIMLTVAGWVLLFVGLLGLMVGVAGGWGVCLWLFTLATASMVVNRYRASERSALLWTLAIAAERGMPLAPAARSFGEERWGVVGRRAMALADRLEAGAPLHAALWASKIPLSTEGQLAAQLGVQTGTLGVLLTEASQESARGEQAWRPLCVKLFYFAFLMLYVTTVFGFLMIKVAPAYDKIFEGYDTQLPVVTRTVFQMSGVVSRYGILILPLYLALLATFLIALAHYMGWIRFEPRPSVRWRYFNPVWLMVRRLVQTVMNWFLIRADGALVLRSLAHTVHRQRPLPEALSLLAETYPKPNIRMSKKGARFRMWTRR